MARMSFKEVAQQIGMVILLSIVALALTSTCCSCRSTDKLVYKTDTIYFEKASKDSVNIQFKTIVKDSVVYKDSTITIVDSVGKPIYVERWHTYNGYHEKVDSSGYFKAICDSLNRKIVSLSKEKEVVTKEPSWIDNMSAKFGKYIILTLVLILTYIVLSKVMKLKIPKG